MALSIKIVTTNGIVRQFYQSDGELIQALIHRLKHRSNIFTSSSFVLSSELQTEVFSPKYIATIELNWNHFESLKLIPTGLDFVAIGANEADYAFDLDLESDLNSESENESNRTKVQFYFVGGHSITTELIVDQREIPPAEQTQRILKSFEQPVIYYQTESGFGLINPRVMTRMILTPFARHLPTETIFVDDY
ncbi:MAG: hypothetical protein KA902_03325 [Arenimonas sp.]|nr:hypothetical protein [Arenimonas sp.]